MICVFKWRREEHGQDIAEYAIMLAVIMAVVVGAIRLIGSVLRSGKFNAIDLVMVA